MNFNQMVQKVQEELKAPKNQFNTFGKYKYRSLEDILEAVKPLLARYGMCITITDEIVQVGDRYYVKATARLSDDKDSMTCKGYAREPLVQKGMNEPQITGATSSYARKYAVNGLLAIDDAKDADGTNKNGASKPKEKQDEIVEQAFFEFTTKNKDNLIEGFAFSKDKFIEAIIKCAPTHALPTRKESIPKILKMVKLEEVMVEVPNIPEWEE